MSERARCLDVQGDAEAARFFRTTEHERGRSFQGAVACVQMDLCLACIVAESNTFKTHLCVRVFYVCVRVCYVCVCICVVSVHCAFVCVCVCVSPITGGGGASPAVCICAFIDKHIAYSIFRVESCSNLRAVPDLRCRIYLYIVFTSIQAHVHHNNCIVRSHQISL